jgi:N-acyl-D-aspartate/D-glutamate deacylase
LTAVAQRPMAITILQRDNKPEEWRQITGWIAEANAAGDQMLGQVLTRATGVLLGFEISQNPFVGCPSYQAIAGLPFEQRLAALRTPELRALLLAETTDDPVLARRVSRWDRIFPLGDPPDYEPAPEHSIAARAEREGRKPADLAYDLLLENGGKAILYRPLSNYTYGNLDTVHDMLTHPATIVGLGDGGAHVGILSDASFISTMLTHWTRDRTRGDRVTLPWAVKRVTLDSAQAIGLRDRGVVAAGCKADLNVIDYDRLRLRSPEVVYDLPSGGRRLIQRADGYEATIVSGVPVYRDGAATGALPGRLVRGAQAAPR